MDKYEYNVKSDQIKKLYSRKEFEAAAKIADEIDWIRVKDNTMLNRVADIYENVKQYEKAKEVLLIAYERSSLGRQLAYKLTILALRTNNFVEADEFYQDFVEMSPSDVTQYLLKYRIAKAKGEDIEVLIRILEAYVEVEMDERWQYELAKLYHEAGEDDKCIAMCDELELWFNDGKYVEKAKELRKLITGVLSEYNKRYASDTSINHVYANVDYSTYDDNEATDGGDVEQEDNGEIQEFAEALVESEEEEDAVTSVEEEDEDEDLEELDDTMSDMEEFLDDDMSSEETAKAVVDEAAKQVAKMAQDAEMSIPVETEEERAANEALRAAEAAALEAQKAADLARKLVEEARSKALQAKTRASETKEEPAKSKFSGMSANEISRVLEEEDLLKGNSEITSKKDSMIEIFEFDQSKDGKCSNIGEELTKTAEIDVNEINFKLEETDNLYNTANIQAALARSMEKILDAENNRSRNAFDMHIDEDDKEIRPAESGDAGFVDENEIQEEEPQQEIELVEEISEEELSQQIELVEELPEEGSVEELPQEIEAVEEISEDELPQETESIEEISVEEPVEELSQEIEPVEDVSEEETEEELSQETEPVDELAEERHDAVFRPMDEEEEEDDFYLTDDQYENDEPTKRIDRDEINRILSASKNIYQTVPLSPLFDQESDGQIGMAKEPEEEEQIEGQMTIDEVLAEYERIEAEKEKIEEAKEEADIEKLEDIEETADIEESEDTEETVDIEESEDTEETVDIEELEDTEEYESIELEDAEDDYVAPALDNATIPDEYRSIFNDFVGTGSMEEDIAATLDNLINNFTMDGTSKTNNVIITGSAKIGKTTLGLSLIKAANKGRNRSGRRVAKVKATALNKRGVSPAMTQILGTDLIIEQAGNLMPNTIVDLMIAMKNYTEEMLIILEDDKAAIDRMLVNYPDLKNFFTNRLDIHEMEINDMVKIARDYAEEQMFTFDEIGELALFAKLDDISGRNPVLSIEDIQEVVDDAIEHANKFSLGKIFGRRKKTSDGLGILTEQDFM